MVRKATHISQILENVIKQKGVTLDVANLTVVTFEAVKKMVLSDGSIKTMKRFNFRWKAGNSVSSTKN